uniref:T-lymphocyte surface antigen Ly-9-like n=1 Tax=Haplochromis burtoni TaxID=8153 RepID=A0A3Q2X805_HAPBU
MIEWFMDDEKLEEKEKTLTRVAKDVANARFSCNVSNPVSSDISLPVQQNCYELYSQDVCNLYGAIGDSIVVPLNHKLDKASVLKWKHNDTIIFEQRKNKSPNPIYVKGKKDDINPDGSLKLTNLDANDSGNYIPKVYSQDGALESNMKITRLCVLARVQKPRVKIMCPNKSEVKFTCVVSQNDFNIEWLMEGKRLKEKEMTLTRVAKDVVNASFSCNVSNPVSSELSLPVQQNCYAPHSQDGCDEYAATGSSFTVPLKHKLQESENLRWFHNTTIIFNSKLDKRTKRNTRKDFFVDSTGSLKLTKLMKDNSGQYAPIVHDEEGRNVAHLLSLSLCVLDPVQKPNVTMKCTGSTINVSFTCSVDQKENYLEYKWLTKDKELEGNLKDTLTKKAEDVMNLPIACNVSNPVSFAISEPVYQECLKLYVAGEKSGPNIWVFVRFGAGFFLLLLLTVIVCATSLTQKNKYAIRGKIYYLCMCAFIYITIDIIIIYF